MTPLMSYLDAPMWPSTRPRRTAETVSLLVNACRRWRITTGQQARFVQVAAIYKNQQRRDRVAILEKLGCSVILRTRTLPCSAQTFGEHYFAINPWQNASPICQELVSDWDTRLSRCGNIDF